MDEKIENKKSSKKFKNVNIKLSDNVKSCPNCAKVLPKEQDKCSCGYSFKKKSKGMLISLIICLVVMGALSLCVYLDVSFIKDNLKIIIYVLGGIGIFSVVYKSLFNGENEKISYSAEEKMSKRTLSKFKKVSIVLILMGVVLLIFLGVYVVLSYFNIW